MSDFLSLHDAERIAADAAPVKAPGLTRVVAGLAMRPAETLREVLAHPSAAQATLLAALGGVYWAVNFAVAQGSGASVPLGTLLAVCVAAGAPGGIAYMYALSILLHWACEVLGGEPTRGRLRAALAYAGVPGIAALVLFGVPRLLIFGPSLFLPERTWMSANPALVWGLWFGDAVFFAWSLTLIVRALKIVNGFSTARAVLAALLPIVPIVLIGVLFLVIAWTGMFFAPPAF
ncbi:MAG TPA: Yip1 family protein [Candidatus Polarisedimenticolia bacterium]|nr:Yip1 family protein [Candidatus Polarisedimenticolia bacterium]